MEPHTDPHPRTVDVVSSVLGALTRLADAPSREVLREALYAVSAARDDEQLRLRLTLLASLVAELFRHDAPVALPVLDAIERALQPA